MSAQLATTVRAIIGTPALRATLAPWVLPRRLSALLDITAPQRALSPTLASPLQVNTRPVAGRHAQLSAAVVPPTLPRQSQAPAPAQLPI